MYDMMGFRDSLKYDAGKLSNKKATVRELTGIENHRRKLEARIKAFHRQADTLMNLEDLEDLTPVDVGVDVDVQDGERKVLEEWAGLDPGEDKDFEGGDEASSTASSSQPDITSDLESDQEELLAYPEKMALSLPSRLGRDYITRHGLETLAKQEIELRVGQANDSLAARTAGRIGTQILAFPKQSSV
jgi:hypothetical protein